MKVLVTGCGRGGTNLGIEVIRELGVFNVTEQVEDRNFFLHEFLPEGYATKLATENRGFNTTNIEMRMERDPDLMVIFMLRHPIDTVLSKMYRGRPYEQGGDCEGFAADGSLEGACAAVKAMYNIYSFLIVRYPERVCTVVMEELIGNPFDETERVKKFLNLEHIETKCEFYKNNRNRFQKKRYGDQLVSNINLHKNLDAAFDGYFKDKQHILNDIKERLNMNYV